MILTGRVNPASWCGAGWLALALLLPATLPGQVTTGDSAWAAGDFHTARIAYERALHDDPGSVRALYRLGILASWDGRLDSALTLLRDAREIEPAEPDVRLHQATVLAWAGRYPASLALYDSLTAEFPGRRDMAAGRAQTLAWAGRFDAADSAWAALVARDPGDVDALAGRAQVAAWSGDLEGAVHRYQDALARDPQHVASLVGLAQVRQWQGRPGEARQAVNRALAVAPADRSAREVSAAIRAMVRPQLELTLGWSRDSDRNTLWWQNVASSMALGPGLRGFVRAGLAEATDPVRTGTRLSGEVGASYDAGRLSFTAAVGARRLSAEGAPDRSLGTWRGSAGYRLTRGAGAGIGYAHYSFDETALLLGRDLDVDEISLDSDAELTPALSLGLGAGLAWVSDGNQRRYAVVALNRRMSRRLTLGVFARALGYDQPGAGYFTPDRFLVGEGRATWSYGLRHWDTRLSAGLGAQQIGRGARAQSEWHAEARLARRWSVLNEVALSAGFSNSAESSTTGAFRYYTAALSLRLGL